jgi:hypothetical protein
MTRSARDWITSRLPAGVYDALATGLSASRLWSLLLEILEVRAGARRPADLVAQWDRDRFVQPAAVDQRTLIEIDRTLFAAADAFESIELSPVAPLGVCSIMGRTSQHKVLSALRGTEVVADPTNVMALECARRLRRDPAAVVRLSTSHRCVRAQEIPKVPGLSANFRIFCLASAGFEQPDSAFVIASLAEQMTTTASALDALEQRGFAFPDRRVTLLTTPEKTEFGDRLAAAIRYPGLVRAVLEHPYYDGFRFQIAARASDGAHMPLIDGGALDWLSKLMSNRRAVYVASGFGSQLVQLRFRRS